MNTKVEQLKNKVEILESLVGIIPDTYTEHDAKEERLSKK